MLNNPPFLQALKIGTWRRDFDSVGRWLDRLEQRPKLTVIIPIYNGFDPLAQLLACEALWEEADFVLLIDDHSSDPRVKEAVNAALKNRQNGLFLSNARNLGFVRTVNRGLRERPPDSDVLILNSDTVLPAGWSHSLPATAYAYDDVATVCAVSNAAGFFSIPRPNESNAIPANWSLDQCSRLLSLISPRMHEEAIATSGFCWFVRNDAISKLGLLDDLMFHRGYAEDTDYCLRALDFGLRNLCSFTTYVKHVRGESFLDEKGPLKQLNSNILKAMQPTLVTRLKAYEATSIIHDLGRAFGRITQESQIENYELVRNNDTALILQDGQFDHLPNSSVAISRQQGTIRSSVDSDPITINGSTDRLEDFICYLILRSAPRTVQSDGMLPSNIRRAAAIVDAFHNTHVQ